MWTRTNPGQIFLKEQFLGESMRTQELGCLAVTLNRSKLVGSSGFLSGAHGTQIASYSEEPAASEE